ncbi:hypothetical protein J4477_03755 [Candidatus Pacearchaeota archaeon]|nr:hypothetical protein [Candidatus Pacearchaeota archaeon]
MKTKSIFEIGNAERIMRDHFDSFTIYLVRQGLAEITRKSNGTSYDPSYSAIPRDYATTAIVLHDMVLNGEDIEDRDILQVYKDINGDYNLSSPQMPIFPEDYEEEESVA